MTQQELIARIYARQGSMRRTQKVTGFSYQRVRNALIDEGVVNDPADDLTAKEKREIRAAYKSHDLRRTAKIAKVSDFTVRRYLLKIGLLERHGGTRDTIDEYERTSSGSGRLWDITVDPAFASDLERWARSTCSSNALESMHVHRLSFNYLESLAGSACGKSTWTRLRQRRLRRSRDRDDA
jgi:hypothetical protein